MLHPSTIAYATLTHSTPRRKGALPRIWRARADTSRGAIGCGLASVSPPPTSSNASASRAKTASSTKLVRQPQCVCTKPPMNGAQMGPSDQTTVIHVK